MKWLILALGVLCNASASVLVKLAMTPPRRFPTLADPVSAITNWPFWVGLCMYGGAFLLYAAALARLPLNVAQPTLTAGAIAAVAVLSVILFHEPMRWTTAVGILLVGAGVCFLTVFTR